MIISNLIFSTSQSKSFVILTEFVCACQSTSIAFITRKLLPLRWIFFCLESFSARRIQIEKSTENDYLFSNIVPKINLNLKHFCNFLINLKHFLKHFLFFNYIFYFLILVFNMRLQILTLFIFSELRNNFYSVDNYCNLSNWTYFNSCDKICTFGTSFDRVWWWPRIHSEYADGKTATMFNWTFNRSWMQHLTVLF